MKKHFFIFCILVIALLCLAIWFMPAAVATYTIRSNCNGLCELSHEQGRFWDGQAELYARQHSQANAWNYLGILTWHWDFSALRQLDVRVNGYLDAGTVSISKPLLSAGLDSLSINANNLRLPAGVILSHVGHGLPTSGWGGWLHILHTNFNFNRANVQTKGEVRWINARSTALSKKVLGHYTVTWKDQQDKKQINLRIKTDPKQPALLALDGAAFANVTTQNLKFNGSAELKSKDETLEALLGVVGRPDANNPKRFLLTWPK